MNKQILLFLCLIASIFCISYNSSAIYPPLPSTRGIDILVPFANSNDLAACLISDRHSYQQSFFVYNLSSKIAPTANHIIFNYTLPNGQYIDYLDGLNSYGEEYFAGFVEQNGVKSIQIFNYTGINNAVDIITDVWQRVVIQGQANVKCSSCLLYGTMNYDGSWNFIQYDWMKQKQLFQITTDESLDDVYMLDTELVGNVQTIIYSAVKTVSPFQVFSFVMVSSDGTEIWRKETSQDSMVIQAQQYYSNYMLVVSLNQQVQLMDRNTGNYYDELNTGFSSDIRCAGMYPYVACTDYGVVKIWNWDPIKGTVATLVASVVEVEKIHDIGSNYFGQQFVYISGNYIKTINM